ncbi:MAG: efflux RND transporter permease subunit [bacterium]
MNQKNKKQNKLLILIPLALLLVWFIISGIGGPVFGKLADVSSNDQVNFLPASADSTKVQNVIAKYQSSKSVPAIVVITSNSKIGTSQLIHYQALDPKITSIKGVQSGKAGVLGPIPSKDGLAVEYVIQITDTSNIGGVVKDIRSTVDAGLISGDKAYVTGPAGIAADLIKAFGGIDGILLFVAVGTVFVILLLVYRSIILPFLVLISAMFALTGAILVIYYLAKNNVIKLNGQSQGILSILVIGASTDYALLIISRYREALDHLQSRYDAAWRAIKFSFEPILASASTVILALLCLLFSDSNANKSLGPVAAIGIAFSFLSAMTLLPAFLVIFGRVSFWPFSPKFTGEVDSHNPVLEYNKGLWTTIPKFIEKRFRIIWIGLIVILIGLSSGLLQLKASGISQSSSILGKSNAVEGQSIAAAHFPAGTGSPAEIITPVNTSLTVLNSIKQTAGISNAVIYSEPGTILPKVVDGKVLIIATLSAVADSSQGTQTVVNLRALLRNIEPQAVVGGITAVTLDTNNTARADLKKIIPIVLAVILLILILLLRAIIAPLILIFSVILSFSASLGVSALVFNHLFHFPGSDPSVPLFGFIFLVALGVDYNIFLMSRVREETLKLKTRPGILLGLSLTGGVITSAGIVLAATFASLIVIPILFLAQIAFIVAFGVILDTLIVRTFLVPALNYELGKFIWWPSKLWSKTKD